MTLVFLKVLLFLLFHFTPVEPHPHLSAVNVDSKLLIKSIKRIITLHQNTNSKYSVNEFCAPKIIWSNRTEEKFLDKLQNLNWLTSFLEAAKSSFFPTTILSKQFKETGTGKGDSDSENERDDEEKESLKATFIKYSGQCETIIIFDLQSLLLHNTTAGMQIFSERPRHDHFVFLIQRKRKSMALDTISIRQSIFESRIVSGLKFKFVIEFEDQSSKIFLDPKDLRCFSHSINDESHDHLLSLKFLDVSSTTGRLRSNLCGQHVKTTAIRLEPYIVVEDGQPLLGCFYNVITSSALAFNYSYEMDYPIFKGLVKLENKTWIGQMGKVVSGEKDLILGSGQTLDRNYDLDFSTYFGTSDLIFITSHPKVKVKWQAIIYPFDKTVWSMVLISFLTIIIILYIKLEFQFSTGQRQRPSQSQNRINNIYSKENNLRSIFTFQIKIFKFRGWEPVYTAFQLAFGSILGQSATIPKRVRLLALLWVFAGFILGNYFQSNFLAYVTFPEAEKLPSTFTQLENSEDFRIIFMFLNAAATSFFNRTETPVYARLREKFLREKNPLKCIFSTVFQGEKKTACIGQSIFIKTHIARNVTISRIFSPTIMSQDVAQSYHINVGFTKNSKFVETFNDIVGILRDTGHFYKWTGDANEYRTKVGIDWLKSRRDNMYKKLSDLKSRQQAESAGDEAKPFEFENVFVAFFILVSGSFIASFSMTIELILSRHRNDIHRNYVFPHSGKENIIRKILKVFFSRGLNFFDTSLCLLGL